MSLFSSVGSCPSQRASLTSTKEATSTNSSINGRRWKQQTINSLSVLCFTPVCLFLLNANVLSRVCFCRSIIWSMWTWLKSSWMKLSQHIANLSTETTTSGAATKGLSTAYLVKILKMKKSVLISYQMTVTIAHTWLVSWTSSWC